MIALEKVSGNRFTLELDTGLVEVRKGEGRWEGGREAEGEGEREGERGREGEGGGGEGEGRKEEKERGRRREDGTEGGERREGVRRE